MKTLVFCTAYSNTEERWKGRFGKWLEGIKASGIKYDQILLPDDGSAVLPECIEHEVINDFREQSNHEVVILRHGENLGRPSILDYPGWYRSFGSAMAYAKAHKFDKVVHVESDTFVYSDRLANSINEQDAGWRVFWCGKYGMPETGLQVIAGKLGMDLAFTQTNMDYSWWRNQPAERWMNFTFVDQRFVGDRYGESETRVPDNADYAIQIDEHWATSRTK